MTLRLESLPALPLAAGALIAVLALEARSFFEYTMLAAVVAAGIFCIMKCGRAAALSCAAGIAVAAASFFLSRVPDIPAAYLDGGEAEYVFHIDKAHSGRIGQRCEATAIARNGEECLPFRSSVVVSDVPFALSQGDVIGLQTALRPVGMFSEVPYMEAESMYGRPTRIGAAALVSIDEIKFLGRHENFNTRMADFRDRAAGVLYASAMPPEVSSTLASALLGVESPPRSVKERFRVAGLSHLLCISGFHICVIAWIVSFLLFPLRLWSRAGRVRYLVIALLIWVYVAFIGFPSSAVRAAVMLSAFYLVRLMQRQVSPYNTLALAVALLVFIRPMSIFDAGFQLSVSAVLGILLFADRINIVPRHYNAAYKTVMLFAVPVAAMLGTAPVVLAWFHRLPLFSVPANAFASLLFPPFMVLGGVSAFAGLPLGTLPQAMLAIMKKICDYADAGFTLFCSDTVLLLLIAAIGTLALALHCRKRIIAALCLILAVSAVVTACRGGHPDRAIMVCGNGWNTEVCLVDGGKGYVFTARPCRKIPMTADDFFEGHGVEPEDVMLNPDRENLPFVIASGKDFETSLQADILVIDGSFKGDIAELVMETDPSVVIAGAGMNRTRMAEAACTVNGRKLYFIENKAYYSELPSSSSPLRK